MRISLEYLDTFQNKRGDMTMPTIRVWGEGRSNLWTPDGPVNVPKNYDFLPSGDAALTRAVIRASGRKRLFAVMEKVHKRYPSRRVGLWAPASMVAAEWQRLADLRTEGHKARLAEQRRRKQEREVLSFAAAIRERYPGCPADEAQAIAEHACEVGSGRVGRSSAADDPVRAAVVAHIRHEHTEYDGILLSNLEKWMGSYERQVVREQARAEVRDQIDEILRRWEVKSNERSSTHVSHMLTGDQS